MILFKDKEQCTGCTACEQVCPKQAIRMETDKEGFLYPKVNAEECVKCELCRNVCPMNGDTKQTQLPSAYAIKSKEEKVLMESSSGGVFYNLALQILREGGMVVGANMTSDLHVQHEVIENEKDIWRLMGSKYVQSNLNDIFMKIKEELKYRKVLFVGTPCQVEGLKCYLRKGYENLITVDFVCHGVPSPKAFELYVKYVNKREEENITNIKFRNKSISWKEFSVMFEFDSGKKILECFKENLWMKAFINNLFLRPSCYECNFKRKERISDITLGDFWGIQHVSPKVYDEKGVSLCCVNSEKGARLIKNIQDKVIIEKVDFEQAVSYNTAYTKSAARNNLRGWFFEHLDTVPIEKNIVNCLKPNLPTRIDLKLRKIINYNRRL